MSQEKKDCPKCQGMMVHGFVPEYSHAPALGLGWYSGQPKKSFWTGTQVGRDKGMPVGAFRCEKWGASLSFTLTPRLQRNRVPNGKRRPWTRRATLPISLN